MVAKGYVNQEMGCSVIELSNGSEIILEGDEFHLYAPLPYLDGENGEKEEIMVLLVRGEQGNKTVKEVIAYCERVSQEAIEQEKVDPDF